jgi:hypothetical protein
MIEFLGAPGRLIPVRRVATMHRKIGFGKALEHRETIC